MNIDDCLFNDYETRSTLDLPTHGHHEVMPYTEIMMVGVARGLEDPVINGSIGSGTKGPFVSWGRYDLFVYKYLENPSFDTSLWVNAMSLAYYLGFPASLNQFCTAIGVENKKDPRGTRLINKYCKPDPETGEFLTLEGDDRVAFEDYCLQDVRLLQKAWECLIPFYDDWLVHWKDVTEMFERINDRGVPIDRESAAIAIEKVAAAQAEARERCYKLTGFYPTQGLKAREFFGLPNTQKETLAAAGFDDPVKEEVRRIMLHTNKAAVKKLKPMLDMSLTDGRARGTLVCNGAHTGRSSSRKVQFQNMKRQAIDPDYFADVAACKDPIAGAQENIRGFIQAPPGRAFVVVDYAQIEARLLAHFAGAKNLLEAFADPARDPYKETASQFFGVPVEEINGDQRQFGKLGVLGAGYGASGKGISSQAPNYGIEMSEAQGNRLVSAFHRYAPEIDAFRQRFIEAAVRCVKAGRAEEWVGPFKWHTSGDFLTLTLPSGREVRYWQPEAGWRKDAFSFMRRSAAGMFRRVAWHGLCTENVIQAVAADVKHHAMLELESFGHELLFECHDETVAECDQYDAEGYLEETLSVFRGGVDYLPAGLLDAEGSVMLRYSK